MHAYKRLITIHQAIGHTCPALVCAHMACKFYGHKETAEVRSVRMRILHTVAAHPSSESAGKLSY